jgi:hypothetical protein
MMETTRLFFPVWMLFLAPVSWAAIIPGTFLIAFLGLLAALYLSAPKEAPRDERLKAGWADAKKGMWRAWINLCAAYALGAAAMLVPAILTAGMPETGVIRRAALSIAENIYQSPLAVLWALLCFLLSLALSYLLNRAWTFRNTEVGDLKRAAAWLALLTAPYLFFFTFKLYY